MIILDIETSGVSPQENGVLSLGAVDSRSDAEFYMECKLRHGAIAHPRALEINGFSDEEIRDHRKPTDIEVYEKFLWWTEEIKNHYGYTKPIVLAGHNIGHFDILFLEEIHTRSEMQQLKFPFPYRTVDLHSLAYGRFGESLSHEEICIKLGLQPEPKPHHALYGARSEKEAIKLLLQS